MSNPTSAAILAALRTRHPAPAWVFVTEVCTWTGFRGGYDPPQRLDAYAAHTWPSHKLERVCYEVKVSRSDYARELRQPQKRALGLSVSNRFYFVVPVGMHTGLVVPPETGLLFVTEDGQVRVSKGAPWRKTRPPPWSFAVAVLRRATHP